MADAFKKFEVVGTSPESITAAISNGIARAGATVRNMRGFGSKVAEVRGRISKEGKVDQYQVTIRIGADLE